MKSILNFVRQEEGAALAEYGLLVGLIAVVCMVSVALLGTNINTMLNAAATAI